MAKSTRTSKAVFEILISSVDQLVNEMHLVHLVDETRRGRDDILQRRDADEMVHLVDNFFRTKDFAFKM